MSKGRGTKASIEDARVVGGAEPSPPRLSKYSAKTRQPLSDVLLNPEPANGAAGADGVATGSRNSQPSLDRRLNPNAAVFVPSLKVDRLATKIYEDLAPYTRWSTASTEEVSYGHRFEAIWRESCLRHQQDMGTDNEIDGILQLLEEDEQQAMNIGAESYDPKDRTLKRTNILDVIGGGQAQQPQQQEVLSAEGDGQEQRATRRGGKCCDSCLLM